MSLGSFEKQHGLCDVGGKGRASAAHSSRRCSAIRAERHKDDPPVSRPVAAPRPDFYDVRPARHSMRSGAR